MQKLLLLFLFLVPNFFLAQVSTAPATPTANDEITITLTTTGTGLQGYTGDIYAHTGVLTSASSDNGDWKYVIGTWGNNTQQPKLTKVNNTTYTLNITPNVFGFYNIPNGTTVTDLAIVFRSADGTKQTSPDIFIQLYEEGLNVVLTNPSTNNEVFNLNDNITLSAEASMDSDLELFVNNVSQKTGTGTTISNGFTFTNAGTQTVKVTATKNGEQASDEKVVYVKTTTQNAPIPTDLKEGLNKNANNTVTLVLTAPNKTDVFILGDFNNWSLDQDFQMKKDGDQFWLTLSGLDVNTEYAYQYYIDYDIKIADPYATKILDPNNDKYIPTQTYANIKAYPTDLTTGNVSTFLIHESAYNWSTQNFTPTNQNNLIVYEMLLRDFEVVNTDDIGDLKSAMEHLDYLEMLGVNGIELMPISEFEGNDSWGYNPSFHGAQDKAYGTKNDLKKFVDECHKRGMAVILDVVYNHAFSQSPLAQLYWDEINSRPSADNPWLNPIAKHDYNVGFDFNHESAYTKTYVKQTLAYWLDEFKIDGFRYDLSKGFTQNNTLGNTNAWGQYDAARIAILKDYGDYIWSLKPNTIQILEHFAENSEEKELAEYGFLIWGNSNHNYNQNTMGYASEADISWISYQERGWSKANVMGYMESHDEERLMYKNIQYGNSSGSYNVKDVNTALAREELAGNFLFTIPGPKMIWQFGELGYDVSIDENGRTGRKPVRWDYLNNPNRKKIYDVWATLIAFKKKYQAFQTADYTLDVEGLTKSIVLRDAEMDVVVLGNFDVTTKSINPTFTKTGTWYEYYTDTELQVNNVNTMISLQPGEYRLYSTKRLQDPLPVEEHVIAEDGFILYPNPAKHSFKLNKTVSEIEIYDYLGRTIKKFKGNFYPDKSFNIDGLNPGVYLIKISANKGSTTKRLLIN